MAYEVLQTTNINAVMRELRDQREIPGNLKFLARTPEIEATDEEITARFTGQVTIADVINDDQKAVVRQNGAFSMDTTKIPNIKHGAPITQSMLNLLDRINRNATFRDDENIVNGWIDRTEDNLLEGVRQRQEYFIIGSKLNTVTYDRLGVKFTATFATPSDLLITPGVLWSTPATATPIATIQTAIQLGREKYGKNYNWLTMTSTTFRAMIATTEFRDKAQLYSPALYTVFSSGNFPTQDIPKMSQLAGSILNCTIELYDSRYQLPANNGTITSTAFLPDGKVIIEDSADFNSPNAVDWANGVVAESTVAELTGLSVLGGLDFGSGFGPVSYVTAASPDLNPPGMNIWAVTRGFVRKHDLASNALLTVL